MNSNNIYSESGIIITLILIVIPVIFASILVILKAKNSIKTALKKKELEKFKNSLRELSPEKVRELENRRLELEYSLPKNELSGNYIPVDTKGLIDDV